MPLFGVDWTAPSSEIRADVTRLEALPERNKFEQIHLETLRRELDERGTSETHFRPPTPDS